MGSHGPPSLPTPTVLIRGRRKSYREKKKEDRKAREKEEKEKEGDEDKRSREKIRDSVRESQIQDPSNVSVFLPPFFVLHFMFATIFPL